MVGWSKIKIKPEGVVYSLMGRLGIVYESIKIIQFILIIILIILFYIVWNSVTNFQHRLLNGTHNLPCSTFKWLFYIRDGGHVAWGAT